MKYTTLFTIEIEHDYYSISKPDVFRIVPTEATEIVLRNAGLVTKFYNNKLYALVKHIQDTRPLLDLANNIKLQFFLEVVNSNFAQITNCKVADPYNNKLYFSNANSIIDGGEKSVEDELYLHERLPEFDNANTYLYNDLVRSGSNTAYECLKKINATTGNLNNNTQFRNLGKISYANPNSALTFTNLSRDVSLTTPNSAIDIKYFAYDTSSLLFDKEIKSTIIGPLENPNNIDFSGVQIKFSDDNHQPFTEGIYRVTINTQEEFFYFRPTNDWQPYLGLINIHNDDFVTRDEYRFLQPDGSFYMLPANPTEVDIRAYKIRFAPAQHLLKYKCRTNNVVDISDEDGVIQFERLVGTTTFQSTLPVRLKEEAIDTISVNLASSGTLTKTKLPGRNTLSLSEDENSYIISETYLNL
ncbi:hypothetical protein FEE95_00920 [Maribacter algarum]|uniref:Uncharacterized protein n=1 Tax=Maribacter algarum (ex Zhang et al. 2020) TaxID=2578118 RepID=A0A5S3PSW1_9FLAO|nr:hypothetical protein [Maribacter algarum]TMM58020.1 hypothetical protein FEE95_00920 [Maribacter algarum]